MDDALSRLFRTQHGVAAERQLRAHGVTWEQQRGLLHRGRLVRSSPGVFALAGAPNTWEQRAMAATLGTDALVLLDAGAAARLHRLDGHQTHDQLAVLAPYRTTVRCADHVIVSRSRRLSMKDRHVVTHIPVATVPVTLLRLAALGLDPAQALDSALRKGAAPRWLRENFERWRAPGVPGPARCLQLLDDRMGKRLPRSWFQRLAHRALTEHGIVMDEEWPVRDADGRLLAELDLAVVELKVGVECQSIEYHASAADVSRDVHRRRLLRRHGWDIVELWWSDLDRMDDVLADLRLAIERATGKP
jgi:hypothetical protein